MTAREIYQDPWNKWSYVGFVPFVPAVAGKGIKAVDKAIDVAKAVDRTADAAKAVDKTCDAAKQVGHHTIPRAIQKQLPKPVRIHPDVRGHAGNPNVKKVPETWHKDVHSSPPGDYFPGGNYNRRFDELIRKRGGYDKMTPKELNRIRDQVMREYGG